MNNEFFDKFSRELKDKMDNLYVNRRISDNEKEFSFEEAKYVAVKYGYYHALENNYTIDFEMAKLIVSEHSSLIEKMLKHAKNKEEEKELVYISLSINDNSIHLTKSHPLLLLEYLKENCKHDQKYSIKHPDFIKFIRNEHNIEDTHRNDITFLRDQYEDFLEMAKQELSKTTTQENKHSR